jgi:hypothetical protein
LLYSRGQRLLGTGNGEQHGPLGRKRIYSLILNSVSLFFSEPSKIKDLKFLGQFLPAILGQLLCALHHSKKEIIHKRTTKFLVYLEGT